MSAKASNKTKLVEMEHDRDRWQHLAQSKHLAVLLRVIGTEIEITPEDLKQAEGADVYTKQSEADYIMGLAE